MVYPPLNGWVHLVRRFAVGRVHRSAGQPREGAMPRLAAVVVLCLGFMSTAVIGAASISATPPTGSRADAPPSPRVELVAQLGGMPRDVAVDGDTAYLAVGPRVWAVDIADRARPRVRALSPMFVAPVIKVEVAGDHVVAILGGSSLAAKDPPSLVVLSTLADSDRHLRELGRVPLDVTDVRRLAVDGSRVALVGLAEDPADDGVRLIDTVDPAHLAPRRLEVDTASASLSQDLLFVDHRLYVFRSSTNLVDRWIVVLDVTDPTRPQTVAVTAFGGFGATLGDHERVYALDFDIVRGTVDLVVIDVADPAGPVRRPSVQLDRDLGDGPLGLAAEGGYVFVSRFDGSIETYDAAGADAPRRVGVYRDRHRATSIDRAGQTLLLATRGSPDLPPGLRIIDTQQPTGLRVATDLPILPSTVNRVAVVGDFAYVAAEDIGGSLDGRPAGGLWAVDLSDPASPWPAGFLAGPIGRSPLAVDSDLLFAVEPEAGLWAIDVSTPGHPRARGFLGEASGATHLAAGRSLVFADPPSASTSPVLLGVDARDPDHLRPLGRTAVRDGPFQPLLVDAARGRLFGTDGVHLEGQLFTLDLRDPARPRLLATEPGNPRDMLLDGKLLAVDEFGVQRYDVDAITGVRLLDQVEVGTGIESVTQIGRLAVASSPEEDLLHVVDLGGRAGATEILTVTLPVVDPAIRNGRAEQPPDHGRADLAALGSHLLVGSDTGGLLVYRVTDEGAEVRAKVWLPLLRR
jgi:hypothetical protein